MNGIKGFTEKKLGKRGEANISRERERLSSSIHWEGCTNGEGNWSKGRIVRGVDNEHLKIGKNWEAISSGIKRSFGGRICRRLLFFEKFQNIFRINVFATLRRKRLLFFLTRSCLILEREKKAHKLWNKLKPLRIISFYRFSRDSFRIFRRILF